MSGTISDWIIVARQRGLESITRFHTTKSEDYERLKNSGLPIFDDIEVPYSQFTPNNEELTAFFTKYPGFCVRALPNTKDLPRKFKLGIKSFEEAQEFLREKIAQGKEAQYRILANEYGQEEPTTRSGIIISKGEHALVEIADIGLVELSHGDVDKTFIGEFTNHYKGSHRSMRYNTEDPEKRNLIWKALQFIRVNSSDIRFKKGYFEFVITDDNRIFFLDYKTNDAYLN